MSAPASHPCVLITTCSNDFHALTIQRRYSELIGDGCFVVESDASLMSEAGSSWCSDPDEPVLVPTTGGGTVELAEVNALWYRRTNMPQRNLAVDDPDLRNFINRSHAAALLGALETSFYGTWISDPMASSRAENKLVQLRAAVNVGLTVPRTLVSSDPLAIRRFRRELGATGLVMKALTFDKRQPLLTLEVEDRHLHDADAIRMCPTMFQELVPGDCHLRVLVAGDDCHAIAVTSKHLDWRPHLDVDARPVDIEPCTHERLRSMLTVLGLRMGIFDLKLVAGQPVFLEVNPQGQFLFMDGLADVDTATAFARFLHSEAAKDLQRR